MKRLLELLVVLSLCFSASATNYYFDATNGDNENTGLKAKNAFQDLSKIATLELKSGDKVLLKKGETFLGSISLDNVAGTAKSPIVVSSYGKGEKPIIDAKGYLNGILIQDCSFITVEGIEITANGGGLEGYKEGGRYLRCGVLVNVKQRGNYSDIVLNDLFVHDVYFEEIGYSRSLEESLTGNGTQNYGWGIRILNADKNSMLSNILVSKCHVKNVAHSGIRFTGKHPLSKGIHKNIKNAKVTNNFVEYVGGPAMQASVVDNIEFSYNKVDHSGSFDDSRKWGRGSGLWVWGCINALIEHNSFRHANGPGDSAGCHIDFDNRNVIIQYNVSEDNAGGFIEILGNNRNCTYRYNVSINDGSRQSIEGQNLGAGTMVGVNGFVGFGKPPVGPFNTYIYNNTIYVKKGQRPEVGFASTVDGMMIANNVFYVEESTVHDHRNNFLPESGPIGRVFFENNLYLNAENWPTADKVMITDKAPMFGDPKLANPGGLDIVDYIPQDDELIKDKGISIPFLPGDSIGIVGGFEVSVDILGNKITGQPDMGAIEL